MPETSPYRVKKKFKEMDMEILFYLYNKSK